MEIAEPMKLLLSELARQRCEDQMEAINCLDTRERKNHNILYTCITALLPKFFSGAKDVSIQRQTQARKGCKKVVKGIQIMSKIQCLSYNC